MLGVPWSLHSFISHTCRDHARLQDLLCCSGCSLHLCQLYKVLRGPEDMCNMPPWSMEYHQATSNARCHGASVAVEQRQRRVPSPFKCRCEQLAIMHTM